MKGIIYLLIANNTSASPLGEVCLASGNFQLLSMRILEKLGNELNVSKSFIYEDSFVFHYHNSSNLSFICMTDREYPNRFAHLFIAQVRDQLLNDYGEDLKSAVAFSLKQSYLSKIKTQMKSFSNPENLDNLAVANKNVKEVVEIMLQNINLILAREEKIGELVISSEELEANARMFKKSSESTRCAFCCKRLKIMVLLSVLLVAILVISVILICGGTDLHKCRKYTSSIAD